MASHAFNLASPPEDRWPLPADIHNGTAPRNDMSQAAGGWSLLAVLSSASNSEALRPSVTTITSSKKNILFLTPRSSCPATRTAPHRSRIGPLAQVCMVRPLPSISSFLQFRNRRHSSRSDQMYSTARQGRGTYSARTWTSFIV
ncbi:hypothetical protein CMEL01_08213 [Colletotrichum melonis]|uniref:Uncharacterized protein n=1 Tax=Colletotrichum melonis TaxID=1209925 RepID=A0AAI9U201_9PEZI|nr:hypothetical protein CMEL01_08213 [Colletotrichum melonis]